MLTVEEVARHWRLSPTLVRAMIARGILRSDRIAGRHRMSWDAVWSCEGGRRPIEKAAKHYREPLMRKADLAVGLRVSVRTVERWIHDGLPTRNVGASIRLNRREASAWLIARYGVGLPDQMDAGHEAH